MTLTKNDIRDVFKEELKEYGVVTKDNIKDVFKEYGVVTEKKMKSELNKVKRELQTSIANVAFSSPTSNQFNKLEQRVDRLESYKTASV